MSGVKVPPAPGRLPGTAPIPPSKKLTPYTTSPAVKSPMGGRPKRWNQALGEKIIRLTEAGLTVAEMAKACGISDGSIYWWLRGSAADLPGFDDFHTKYYKARVTGYIAKWGTPPDGPVEASAKEPSR